MGDDFKWVYRLVERGTFKEEEHGLPIPVVKLPRKPKSPAFSSDTEANQLLPVIGIIEDCFGAQIPFDYQP